MAQYELLEKYESIKYRFDEIQQQITDPSIMNDMKRYVKLNQEYKNLEKMVNVFREYKNMVDSIDSGKEILEQETDEDLRAMAWEEIELAEKMIPEKEKEIKFLLVPADPEEI